MPLENFFFCSPRQLFVEPITLQQLTGFRPTPDIVPSLVYADGSLYYGDVDPINRVPHGKGILIFKYVNIATSGWKAQAIPQTSLTSFFREGDRYGGDWMDGLFSGDGVLISSMCSYTGPWSLGNPHGRGVMQYSRRYVEPKKSRARGNGEGGGVVSFVSGALWRGLSHLSPFDDSTDKPQEYTGEFHRDYNRHGEGTMQYYNGDVYEGTWMENTRSGFGKLRSSNGEEYEGHWLDDERHGRGLVRYADGSTFKGVFEHNKRQGPGILRLSNGDEYSGSFLDDAMTGEGVMRYRNGDVYEGLWQEGRRHGEGKYTLKKNGATMQGTFIRGLIHGKGTVSLPEVSLFSGTFHRGLRSTGSMFWLDGADEEYRNNLCYQGNWKGEQLHGKGLLWFRNGGFYCGEFQENKRHGKGNMRYPNGEEYSGEFVANIPHGWGVLQTTTKTIIKAGLWHFGKLVEGYVGGWNGKQLHGLGHLSVAAHRLLSSSFDIRYASGSESNGNISPTLHLSSKKQLKPFQINGTVDPVGEGAGLSSPYAGRGGEGHRRFGSVIEFKGIFKNGKREGPGVLKLPAMKNGKLWYSQSSSEMRKQDKSARKKGCRIRRHIIKGFWKGNQLECEKAVWAFPSGEVYVGGFSRNCRDDPFGRLWLPDGSVFVGKWSNDAPSGDGLYFSNNPNAPMFGVEGKSPSVSPLTTLPLSSTDGNPCASGTGAGRGGQEVTHFPSGEHSEGTSRFFFGLWSKRGNSSVSSHEQQKGITSLRKKKPFVCEPHHILLGKWVQQYWGVQRCERMVAPSVMANRRPAQLPASERNDSGQYHYSFLSGSSSSNASTTEITSSRSSSDSSGLSTPVASDQVGRTHRDPEEGSMPPSPSFHPLGPNDNRSAGVATRDHLLIGPGGNPEGVIGLSRILTSRKEARHGPLLWEDGPETTRMVSFSSRAEATHFSQLPLLPSELSIGKIEGDGLVIFPSGIMTLHTFADNCPELAVPFRPHSPLDGYLKHVQVESKRYGRLQAWKGLEILVDSPFSPAMSLANAKKKSFFSHASLKPAVPPSQSSSFTNRLGKISIANPLPTWGDWRPFNFSITDDRKYFGAPIQCSFCSSEYTFFRSASECFFCFRSSCASCLRALDPSLSGSPYLTHLIASSSAIMSAMLPEKEKKVNASHSIPSLKDILVCVDCSETIKLSMSFSIMWIPLRIFSSILTTQTSHSDALTSPVTDIDAEATSSEKDWSEKSTTLNDPDTNGSVVDDENDHDTQPSASYPVSSSCASNAPKRETEEEKVKDIFSVETLSLEKNSSFSPDNPTAVPQVTASPTLSISHAERISSTEDVVPPVGIPRPLQLQDGKGYATYVGYVAKGVPHLYGELWWGRDNYYVGGFTHGEKSGIGCQVLSNGEIYSGTFSQDVWNGYGTYFFSDGSVLEGFFKDGEIDNPTYWGEQKSCLSSSMHPSGKPFFFYHGVGIQFDLGSGSIYNGEWKEGKKHGKGILFYGDGSHFRGTFVEDRIEGPGILVKERSVFCGHFKNGQKDGPAIEFFSDCAVKGTWRNNAGEGCFRIFDSASGDVYETTYRHGNERDDCFVIPEIVPNESTTACQQCGKEFYLFLRQHHCRLCGNIFCDACSKSRATFPDHFSFPSGAPQRVCDACFQRQAQRRSIAIRRYGTGEVYAGAWSKGTWVSRGLYTTPAGLFVVMDNFGHPIQEAIRNASPAVPASVCLDAAPPLSTFHTIHESSPLKALKEFIEWWQKAQKECQLHTPLSIPLVENFERHTGTLLEEKAAATPSGPSTTISPSLTKGVKVYPASIGYTTPIKGKVVKENSSEASLLADGGKSLLEYPAFPSVEDIPQYVPALSPHSSPMDLSTCLKDQQTMTWIALLRKAFHSMPLPLSVRSYISHIQQSSSHFSSDSSEMAVSRKMWTFMPKLDDYDISEKEMEQKMNACATEALVLFPSSSSSSDFVSSPSLFPPTPPVPEYGSDTQVPWNDWEVAQIPFFSSRDDQRHTPSTSSNDSHSPPKQQQERAHGSENGEPEKKVEKEKAGVEEIMTNVAQHYAACPFWRCDVIDVQDLIEHGKVHKACELMTSQTTSTNKGASLFSSHSELSPANDPPRNPLDSQVYKEKENAGWLPGVMSGPLNVTRVLSLVKATEKCIIPCKKGKSCLH